MCSFPGTQVQQAGRAASCMRLVVSASCKSARREASRCSGAVRWWSEGRVAQGSSRQTGQVTWAGCGTVHRHHRPRGWRGVGAFAAATDYEYVHRASALSTVHQRPAVRSTHRRLVEPLRQTKRNMDSKERAIFTHTHPEQSDDWRLAGVGALPKRGAIAAR